MIFVWTLKCDLVLQRGCFCRRALAHAEEPALTAEPVCLSPGRALVKEAPVHVHIPPRGSKDAPVFSRSTLTQVNLTFMIIYT